MTIEKIQLLNQVQILKDELGNLGEISVDNDDVINEEILEVATFIKQMEEKINAR